MTSLPTSSGQPSPTTPLLPRPSGAASPQVGEYRATGEPSEWFKMVSGRSVQSNVQAKPEQEIPASNSEKGLKGVNMERRGWIYLRVVESKGYCIGKTADITRRDAEYSKENPFLETVCVFEVYDMHKVERILINRTAHLRLRSNSKEWLQHSGEVVAIVEKVRRKYALMTYAEWKEIARRRKENRRHQQLGTQDAIRNVQQIAKPTTAMRSVRACPECGFVDKVAWRGDVMYCERCRHSIR